ncbi:hypothetical protein BaRGS_00038730 [Batillaria attramentaria]|uniref:Uncharacterized protein n=1 Tax=Batillaria attramentaria TaxID=370345 RepID=A0ABD0J579_9CAEN
MEWFTKGSKCFTRGSDYGQRGMVCTCCPVSPGPSQDEESPWNKLQHVSWLHLLHPRPSSGDSANQQERISESFTADGGEGGGENFGVGNIVLRASRDLLRV